MLEAIIIMLKYYLNIATAVAEFINFDHFSLVTQPLLTIIVIDEIMGN